MFSLTFISDTCAFIKATEHSRFSALYILDDPGVSDPDNGEVPPWAYRVLARAAQRSNPIVSMVEMAGGTPPRRLCLVYARYSGVEGETSSYIDHGHLATLKRIAPTDLTRYARECGFDLNAIQDVVVEQEPSLLPAFVCAHARWQSAY